MRFSCEHKTKRYSRRVSQQHKSQRTYQLLMNNEWLLLPKDTLSAVASLFNQKDTQERTTSRTHGPYTCIRKLPMCLCKWKYTRSIEYSAETCVLTLLRETWIYNASFRQIERGKSKCSLLLKLPSREIWRNSREKCLTVLTRDFGYIVFKNVNTYTENKYLVFL